MQRTVAACALVVVVAGGVRALSGHEPVASAQGGSAPTPSSSAPGSGSTPTSSAPGTVRLAFVGDTMMGAQEYGLPPSGGRTVLSSVRNLLTGDVVIGNLEGTLTTRGSSKCPPPSNEPSNCYAFRSPPEYASVLRRGGFTMMTLANNHAYDFGPIGLSDTQAALTSAGITHSGSPGTYTVVRAKGVRVAVVAFAPYSWANRVDDIPAAEKLVRRAVTESDVVVVTMHAGAEGNDHQHVRPGVETYLGENRGDSVRFARAVVAAGADVVVGHGPHVMRAMEFQSGRLIAYSLGNFVGYKAFGLRGATSTSGVLQVTLGSDGRFVDGRLHPVRLVGAGVPEPGGDAISTVKALSRSDMPRTAARLDGNGVITPPSASTR